MTARYAIADVASLVGEPTRAAILLALVDGRSLPAGELARAAHLSGPATSLHLAKLTQAGLLAVHPEGRHRYYRLASRDVAHALEALGAIATPSPPARSLSPERAALRTARTCYDHLAGRLAVSFAEMLEQKGRLLAAGERAYALGGDGARWFAEALEIDTSALAGEQRQRVFARRCLDWTERRPHLAGALGAAVLERLVARRWIARTPDSRVVRVTPLGQTGLGRLGVST